MDTLGYTHQPYVVFKHFDISRVHFHIIGCNQSVFDKNQTQIMDSFKLTEVAQEVSKEFNLLGLPR